MSTLLAIAFVFLSTWAARELGYGFLSRAKSSELAGFSQGIVCFLSIIALVLLVGGAYFTALALNFRLTQGILSITGLACFPTVGLITGHLRGKQEITDNSPAGQQT